MAFLFLARLSFPSSRSIPKIIEDCYGERVSKLVFTFERTDLCYRKAELDLSFTKYYFENEFTAKFLHFIVSNQNLKLSDASKQCQTALLKEKIFNKKSIIR